MAERKKLGIVLFQLGGPESLDAVEPFLYNLFCDPDIISFPGAWLARKPLARWIARRRSKIAATHYAEIGGGSPIRELTERQGRALELALSPHFDARAFIAMRYWRPLTSDAVAEIEKASLDELILLPLYPHYSLATTGSSFREWKRLYRLRNIPVRVIDQFHDHPLYIAALIENIESALAGMNNPGGVHLIFSAHGLPMSLVERGDPYPAQIETTVRLVREGGGWRNPHTLCYQSRVGRQKWLEPSLTATIEKLAGEGVKRVLVIPVSFVTEHIETLHEINLEARKEAHALGIEEFAMMPALNDSPRFIAALADLVLRTARSENTVATAAI
jgi:protoporphyrin/coproporphyrin ferrochelatase